MTADVERHLADGVTALRADSPGGRSGAMLVFRVGRFDETLPASGITHLVEHLTLAGPDRPAYSFNAEVSGRFTTFYMESPAARDVADFVARICRGLAADHSSRLEQEKRVLRTEAASRGKPGARGAAYSQRLRDVYAPPAGPVLIMRRHAGNILTGRPVREPAETLRLVAELTGDAIGAAAAGLYASMIVATPGRLPAVEGRMPQLPQCSAAQIEGGTSYRSRESAATLTIGERGVMLTAEPGRFVAVPSDQVAAVLKWNDAALTLIGTDGFRLQLDPAEWDGADDALRALEAGTDPGLIVAIDSPGRADKRPAVPAAPAGPARPATRRRAWWSPLWIVTAAWLACLVFAVLYKSAILAFGVWLGAVYTGSTLLRRALLRARRAARARRRSRPGSPG
jgi:hypothetical protein